MRPYYPPDSFAEMDTTVPRAYGWDDLADCAAPRFIEQDADEGKVPTYRLNWPADFKDEVLVRLLVLNADCVALECAGLAVDGATRKKRRAGDDGEDDPHGNVDKLVLRLMKDGVFIG
jgi:hypothetical protein